MSRALGSWSSCLHFVESVVPAYRHVLEVIADPTLVPRGVLRGWWQNLKSAHTFDWHDPDHIHRNMPAAVKHEIGEHAVTLFLSNAWEFPFRVMIGPLRTQNTAIIEAGKSAWIEAAGADFSEGDRVGLETLWDNEVSPNGAERITRWFPRGVRPLPASVIAPWRFRRPRCPRKRRTVESNGVLARGWSSMVASAWWRGFWAAICIPVLGVLIWAFGSSIWNASVAPYQGRIAAFSGFDAWDTTIAIQREPFSASQGHENQLGFASFAYSPMAGSYSLYFDVGAGTGEHITRADLVRGEESLRGTGVPLDIVDSSHAFLIDAPAGCRFLSLTITDGKGGTLDDHFDLMGQFPDGGKA